MEIFSPLPYLERTKNSLIQRVDLLRQQGKAPKIAAIMYQEDKGSQLYTGIKREVAGSLGIGYEVFEFSLSGGVEPVMAKINELNADPNVTGIIVQKPTRKIWAEINYLDGKDRDIKNAYDTWWHLQTNLIAPQKDVDGLNPSIIEVIANDQLIVKNRVLPATAKAVLAILDEAKIDLSRANIVILGKSDLLGIPLYHYFLSKKYTVQNLGRKDLEERQRKGVGLTDFDVIISATGVRNLVTGELVKEGVAIVDVGEPKGDVDFESVKNKVSFITPVPGGVGPMTVVCLMSNACDIIQAQ